MGQLLLARSSNCCGFGLNTGYCIGCFNCCGFGLATGCSVGCFFALLALVAAFFFLDHSFSADSISSLALEALGFARFAFECFALTELGAVTAVFGLLSVPYFDNIF